MGHTSVVILTWLSTSEPPRRLAEEWNGLLQGWSCLVSQFRIMWWHSCFRGKNTSLCDSPRIPPSPWDCSVLELIKMAGRSQLCSSLSRSTLSGTPTVAGSWPRREYSHPANHIRELVYQYTTANEYKKFVYFQSHPAMTGRLEQRMFLAIAYEFTENGCILRTFKRDVGSSALQKSQSWTVDRESLSRRDSQPWNHFLYIRGWHFYVWDVFSCTVVHVIPYSPHKQEYDMVVLKALYL